MIGIFNGVGHFEVEGLRFAPICMGR